MGDNGPAECAGAVCPSTPRQSPPPRVWTVSDLRRMIMGQTGAGDLVVQYQPIMRACDGQPLAVEALARWCLPDGSVVSPDRFVPVAESHGLGVSLDAAVMNRALMQLRTWDAAGIRVHRVAVNLGRSSVMHHRLHADVVRACADAGLDGDRLALEVLEHDKLDLDGCAVARLQLLSEAGTTIAVDDFGSGYAGLSLLARLPVGVVKMDRSLLPGSVRVAAVGAPSAERLFDAAVALARAVGAEVTAEGVETQQQWQLAVRAGVEHVQGWLFAPALDADDVQAFWQKRGGSVEEAVPAGSGEPTPVG